MNYVEPIRDKNKVKEMLERADRKGKKYRVMLEIGFYCGLRISDILKLTVDDVRDRKTINIREKKTGKQRMFDINPVLSKTFKDYTVDKMGSEYLIQADGPINRPIGRQWAWQVIKELSRDCGLENIGTHTLRKTFGYHHYMQFKDVVLLQTIFNHATPQHTLRYIGIEQSKANEALRNSHKLYT